MYLAEVINERDPERRRLAIERLIHPDVEHLSLERAVRGRRAFGEQIRDFVAPMTSGMRATLSSPPQIDAGSVFFRWQMADGDEPPVAEGSAFVVFRDGLAGWIYGTLRLAPPA